MEDFVLSRKQDLNGVRAQVLPFVQLPFQQQWKMRCASLSSLVSNFWVDALWIAQDDLAELQAPLQPSNPCDWLNRLLTATILYFTLIVG
jgi:hypothetical protein